MFKFEFKEATAVLLVLAAGSIAIALFGKNLLNLSEELTMGIRVAFAIVGIAFLALFLVLVRRLPAEMLQRL